MRDELQRLYDGSSAEDIAATTALVARATGAAPSSDVITITPGMAVRLFFDHNKQNRVWSWRTTSDYRDEAKSGRWLFTNQGIGFLKTGELGDGQHRLPAWALAGKPVAVAVVFGMETEAVVMLDSGKRRQGADALHILTHMEHANKKAAMMKRAFTFLAKARPGTLRIRFNHELADLVRQHHDVIQEAQRLGQQSVLGIAKPTLSGNDAQDLALVLLLSGWPRGIIMEKLSLLQRGEDVGENSPFFVAAKLLDRQARTDRAVSPSARYAITVKAFQLDHEGIKAVRPSNLREVMKPKNFPDPTYHSEPTTLA